MKKIITLFLSVVLLLGLVSCSGYSSSYSATMLVRINEGASCSASWGTLKGRLVLNATKNAGETENAIHYTASLEEGEIIVYYAIRGTGDVQKTELFRLSGGEQADSSAGYVEAGSKVQIIIETNGATKGGRVAVNLE